MSGELIKHTERLTDGKNVSRDEPWRRVWAQLGGTTLSVWDMEEIQLASKQGRQIPPAYINVTDAVSTVYQRFCPSTTQGVGLLFTSL